MNLKTIKYISINFLLIFTIFSTGVFAQKEKILATNGEYKLTENNVQVYVKMLQFVIGQKIKTTETAEIRREAVKEFGEDPQKFFDELNQVESLMNNLYQLNDPIKIAEGRMIFINEFYKITNSTAANKLPSIVKISNRYVKVLHFNPQTQLALTNKDIEAVLNYIDFSRKLSGLSVLSYAEKQNFRQFLPDYYAQLPPQYQAIFPVMPIFWETIEGQWKRLTPKQQQQAIAQFKAQNVQQNVPVYQTPNNTYQNQQNMQQQQQIYQTLSNMSRSSHLTTMNILENIGDGGGYWKMSDNL